MSDVRVPPRTASPTHRAEQLGAREAKLSRRFLWWVLAAPFVGFALAGRVLNLTEGDWELWKAALLGALMMAPFGVGGRTSGCGRSSGGAAAAGSASPPT